MQRNSAHLYFSGALFLCRQRRNQRRIHKNLARLHGVVSASVLIGEKALHYIKFCTSPFNYLRMVDSAVFRCVKEISESRSAYTERCTCPYFSFSYVFFVVLGHVCVCVCVCVCKLSIFCRAITRKSLH